MSGQALQIFLKKTLSDVVVYVEHAKRKTAPRTSLPTVEPLVNSQFAVENGHRNSWFTQLQNGDFP